MNHIANEYFEAHKQLSENDYQILLASEKIFITTTKEGDVSKGGTLLADNWADALLIAIDRGFNETIDGILIDEIPYNEITPLILN